MVELLIVLSTSAAPDTADALGARVHILSSLPPRLYVVETQESAQALQQAPGVEAVASPSDPPPATLSENERLFFQGWRQRGLPKSRPGEGKSWDAEGFLPPDPPRKH